MIRCDQETCRDLQSAISREWLETNGIGGFASSTIAGVNTRRYHALLVAALHPPTDRYVLLSKCEETLVINGKRIDLSSNEYGDVVHPRGYEYLADFRIDPFPVFRYEVEGVTIEKSLFLVYGRNTVVLSYKVISAPRATSVSLEVRPLIAFRDYHGSTHENTAIQGACVDYHGALRITPYAGLPSLFLAHNAASFTGDGCWYRNFFYRAERERGLEANEDLFNPVTLSYNLARKQEAVLIAGTEPVRVEQARDWRRAEIDRRAALAPAGATDAERQLAMAADQFLVRRGERHTVIAGYPWFTDWGRDTMIALPGLTLYNGQSDIARDILENFAAHVDQGMLPNRFPDHNETPEYNTVDATLWFFEAARLYAERTGDFEFIREKLYPVLSTIVDWHVKGTRYNIKVLDNGLLNAGEPGVQLTWMDAKIGDWVVTPRISKPVEIQALWYNALKTMEDFAERFHDEPGKTRFRKLSTLLNWTFNRVFWNAEAGCLFDVVNGVPDASIRPNQIFAVSLHHSMLSRDRAKAVVEVVERELLTPYGLRTLSPRDSRYIGHYGGNAYQRDSAYHQGTVWPWLLGHFADAYRRVHGSSEQTEDRIQQFLQPITDFMQREGLGQVPEIFSGDAPQNPCGCFAQAWSVAELLRANAIAQEVVLCREQAVSA